MLQLCPLLDGFFQRCIIRLACLLLAAFLSESCVDLFHQAFVLVKLKLQLVQKSLSIARLAGNSGSRGTGRKGLNLLPCDQRSKHSHFCTRHTHVSRLFHPNNRTHNWLKRGILASLEGTQDGASWYCLCSMTTESFVADWLWRRMVRRDCCLGPTTLCFSFCVISFLTLQQVLLFLLISLPQPVGGGKCGDAPWNGQDVSRT